MMGLCYPRIRLAVERVVLTQAYLAKTGFRQRSRGEGQTARRWPYAAHGAVSPHVSIQTRFRSGIVSQSKDHLGAGRGFLLGSGGPWATSRQSCWALVFNDGPRAGSMVYWNSASH